VAGGLVGLEPFGQWAGLLNLFQIFSNYSNFAQILEYKTKTILMSQNIEAWHGARVDHSKQLLPLGPLPIPNRIQVIKIGNNLHFDFFP
jgi:hypothetical protein